METSFFGILTSRKTFYILLGVLILLTAVFRLNIGSYPYIKDEASTLLYIKRGENTFSKEFIFKTKRPPLQYQLAQTMHSLGISLENEFAMRLPYMLAGFGAVVMLYLYIFELTNNSISAFTGAAIFGINGLIIALGKIVQYQPFVMLFSVVCLYLMHKYSNSSKLKYLIWSALCFCVGFYFHWDIVFIAPMLAFYFYKGFDIKHILPAALVLLPLVIFYIVPYFYKGGAAIDGGYLQGRVGVAHGTFAERLSNYADTFVLYNPYVFTPFFIFGFFFAVLAVYKRPFEYMWFLVVTAIFYFFVTKAGTHVYNLLLPFCIVFGIALTYLFEKVKPVSYGLISIFLIILLGFLSYQSYLLFVDLSVEYPWQREEILAGKKTQKYSSEDSVRYMIGFPSNRFYKEAAVQLQATYPDYNEFTFYTNDNTKQGEFYLGLPAAKSEKMFLFAIKDPINFVQDSKFKEYSGKKEILKLKNADGRTLTKVYVYYAGISE